MKLKEAKIILPKFTKTGDPAGGLHDELAKTLKDNYKSPIKLEAKMIVADQQSRTVYESGFMYSVWAEGTKEDRQLFTEMVKTYAKRLGYASIFAANFGEGLEFVEA